MPSTSARVLVAWRMSPCCAAVVPRVVFVVLAMVTEPVMASLTGVMITVDVAEEVRDPSETRVVRVRAVLLLVAVV